MRKSVLFFVFAIVLVCTVRPAVAANAPLWMRYPAISPDGTAIVFSFRGNLYRVNATGGTAVPLTLDASHDFMPVWSRDGKMIAFASDRHGNYDVFVMPSDGGQATRLTYHSARDFPSDFTPDGKAVLFSSSRVDAPDCRLFPTGALPELYRVSITGGTPKQLLTTPAEKTRTFRDGNRLIYQDKTGIENQWRKHHVSSVAHDLWISDPAKHSFKLLTTFPGEDRNPMLSKDEKTVYFLSERSGSFNVYRMPLDESAKPKQLTKFTGDPVRFLTKTDEGTLCFGFKGEIYSMNPGEPPKKVTIRIQEDPAGTGVDLLDVGKATDFAVSSNGKEIAVVFRGDVFAVSVESGATRQVTRTPGAERDVSFSPDGKIILYSSERKGSINIYQSKLFQPDEKYFFNATLFNETPVLETPEDTIMPRFSPDGKEVAFIQEKTILKALNLVSGKVRTVLPGKFNFSYSDGDQWYDWSPDGKWFLVPFQNDTYFSTEMGLVSADGKKAPLNLTHSGFDDMQPSWMAKGSMMLWYSNRDGLHSLASTGRSQLDVYALFATKKAFDRFKLTKEEMVLVKETEKEAKKDENKPNNDKKAKKEEKKKEIKPISIDFEGLADRKVRLTEQSAFLSGAVVTPDAEKLIFMAKFEKKYEIWVTDLREHKTKVLAKLGSRRGGDLKLGPKGKYVFVMSSGKITRVDIKSGKTKGISPKGEMVLDRRAERSAMFDHVWRQIQKRLYRDAPLKNNRWEALGKEYRAYLPFISNNHDFAELLSELLGELNASHTGGRFYTMDPKGDQTASLGLLFDSNWAGNGLKVKEVLEKSPLDRSDTRVAPGVVIEKINGILLSPAINVNRLLNRKSGQKVLLSLFDPTGKKRWNETIKPESTRKMAEQLYQRWVKRNRDEVDRLSKGRLGYVHIRSMSDSSFRELYSEALGRMAGKEALVVDTRFNGGGDLVDDLVTFLNGKKYMSFKPPRQGIVGQESHDKWTNPSIVIASEGNYSDAHCFPWAYHALKLGKIVGMPVAGTCTFVWWERLQDSSLVYGIPNMAVEGNNGTALEGAQLEPDIRVMNEPSKVSTGLDQQLETAVDVM
ncbi:MAG: PD40 domain-containing protein, partial [Holophagae bacterium]|nr:PD40 domain-containing protein [Holophagae bacterium]